MRMYGHIRKLKGFPRSSRVIDDPLLSFLGGNALAPSSARSRLTLHAPDAITRPFKSPGAAQRGSIFQAALTWAPRPITGDSMKTKAKVKSAARKTAARIVKAVKKSAGKLTASRSAGTAKAAARGSKRPAHKGKAHHPAPKRAAPGKVGAKANHAAAGSRKRPQHAADSSGAELGNGPSEVQVRRMSPGDYMNDVQLDFFRRRLLQMREEVLAREVDVKERLHQREVFADPADRASAEEEHWLDLRLRERESLLLRKIEEALRRIKDKEYGYCEVTGEAIGIPRLLARPTATVCVDVKGHNEQIESQFRDR